ncbi:MAG: hypothetical protein E2601_06315 [Microbacterium sp.]|nr:hypothetical protein [Microbacterium sp.]
MQKTIPGLINEVAAAAKSTVEAAASGASFGLEDLLPPDEWAVVLRDGLGVHVVSGVLRGVLAVLREHDLTSIDLVAAEPRTPFPNVTDDDFGLARRWITFGLAGSPSRDTTLQQEVAIGLAARGWTRNSLRITSTVIAMLILVTHAQILIAATPKQN